LQVSQDFREKWTSIYPLVTEQNWQHIYLTATLPPSLQDMWYRLAGIDPKDTVLIRGPTNRKELGYHIISVNPRLHQRNSVLQETMHLLEQRCTDPEARRIIFTSSVSECNDLAHNLGCFKHHAKMNADDKASSLEDWKKGLITNRDGSIRKETWIVATPGLITGYDYHCIDNVIFLEMGYGLLNLVQGGGRAGRNKQRANVFVLNSDMRPTARKLAKEDLQLQGAMVEWLSDKEKCLRTIISYTMDGKRITCADLEGCNPCGKCQPDSDVACLIHIAIGKAKKPIKAHVPMEDIQTLIPPLHHQPCAPSDSQVWDESMEDMDFGMDNVMRSINLDSITTASPIVATTSSMESVTISNLSTPTSTTSLLKSIPKPSLPTPISTAPSSRTLTPISGPCSPNHSSGLVSTHKRGLSMPDVTKIKDVGMSIKIMAATNVNKQQIKKNKSATLNQMAEFLRGCCRTCWTWKGLLVRDSNHEEFVHCWNPEFCGANLPWGIGPGSFKSLTQLKRNHYCFWCGLPQDVNFVRYQPQCHSNSGGGACAWKGLSWMILYTLHQHPRLWQVVKQRSILKDNMDDIHQFASWCETYEPESCNYWMGLEVVIWFFQERLKGHFLDM